MAASAPPHHTLLTTLSRCALHKASIRNASTTARIHAPRCTARNALHARPRRSHVLRSLASTRPIPQVLIIDCDERSFGLQPKHGIAISKYESSADPEKKDHELTKLIPMLQARAVGDARTRDARYVMRGARCVMPVA